MRSLFVQSGTQDGDDKVSEMRRAFIELEPTNYTMIGEIFCDTGFGDSQMIRKLGLDGFGAAPA